MTAPVLPTFGGLLKTYREAASLTQEELAERAKLSARGISDLERGLRLPRHETVRNLAAALQLGEAERAAFIAAARRRPGPLTPLSTQVAGSPGLPVSATPLIGREREEAALCALLGRPDVRLVTLTGPGGVGKTRLALQAASQFLEEYTDGVYFVSLAPISDPGLVSAAIAQSLGLKELRDRSLVEGLQTNLGNKHLLLLLDNFEHVLAAAPLVAELLAAAPRLSILVTSRAPLRVSGEHEFPTPPLSLPDPTQSVGSDMLLSYAGPALFVQRAQAIKPSLRFRDADAPVVAEICRRLDGLPLAIELAAARINLLTLQELLARLDRRLTLLTHGLRDLPARQQTLRATLDWSYGLLDKSEQRLFARLAPFAGGCTFETAQAVCGHDLGMDLLDGLGSLIEKNLLRREVAGSTALVPGAAGEARFMMLETMREYAQERLAASGEAETLSRRHAEHFLALAELAEPELWGGPQQHTWLRRLESEHDNLRAALDWFFEHGEAARALQMAGALGWFWFITGRLSEGRRWLERALAVEMECEPELRARALTHLGGLAIQQTDHVPAVSALEEAMALWHALGDERWIAFTLFRLGHVLSDRGELQRAQELLETSLALSRGRGEEWGSIRAIPLLFLGELLVERGDDARAALLLEESLALGRRLGDNVAIAASLTNLGWAAHYAGDDERAVALAEEGLALFRALRHNQGMSAALNALGRAALQSGDDARAIGFLGESLLLSIERGSRRHIADSLRSLGMVEVRRGRPVRAARLFGAAATQWEANGQSQMRSIVAFQQALAVARRQLSDAAWGAAWTEGQRMPVEDLVADILASCA